MLHLRYCARLRGVDHLLRVGSGGLGKSARNSDPMPQVAQEAAADSASRILGPRGSDAVSRAAEALSALQAEAAKHRSRQVSASEAASENQIVVSLLTRGAVRRLDPKHILHSRPTTLHHPIGDNGFRVLQLNGGDETHPDVIRAYERQALQLAALVTDHLAHLVEVP